MATKGRIEGLGGWLVLVGIGIVVSPLRIVATLGPLYSTIFSSGAWSLLTTPGSASYNALWGPILVMEIGINVGLIAAWIYVGFLFFQKRQSFPKLYIGMLLFTLVFIVIDAVAVNSVSPNTPVFDAETMREFGRTLVACLIWVPYMKFSKRVAATFTATKDLGRSKWIEAAK